MRITGISLKNFLSYSDEQEVKLKDLNLLVGPNGAGKTNVLRAITFVDRALTRRLSPTDCQSYAYDTSKPFTVKLGISLSNEERRALGEYVILSLISDYQGVSDSLVTFLGFLLRNGERTVDQSPDITDVIISSTMSTLYPLGLRLVVKWGASTSTYELFSGLLHQRPGNTRRLSDLVLTKLRDLGYSFPPNLHVNTPDELPSIGLPKIVEEGFKNFGMIQLPSVSLDILQQPVAEGIRESSWYSHLLQFLAKRKRFDVNITFDELFIIMFNSSLVVFDQWRGRPPEYVELAGTIEPQSGYDFWGLKNQSLSETLTLDAESVTRTLFELYTSDSVENRQRFRDIESRMCELTGFKPLIIVGTDKKSVRRKVTELRTLQDLGSPTTNASASTLPEKEETRRVYVYRLAFERQADKRVFGWDRLAAGDVETLFILTALEGYEERVILLDEPGQNLHPTRQRQILEVIKEASKKNQILFITHSSHLVDQEVIPGIIRITSKNKVSKFHQIREEFSEDEWKAIGKNQGLIESLFSRATVMCEGDDEYWVVQISLPKALGVGTVADSEIVTVRGEGKSNLKDYCNILEKFGVDFFILCDEDTFNEMKEEYKSRCVYFRDKDTYEFMEEKYSNEFEVCKKELGRYEKRDRVVLRCVLEKIEPPDAVKELSQKLESETSDKVSTNYESHTGPSTKA